MTLTGQFQELQDRLNDKADQMQTIIGFDIAQQVKDIRTMRQISQTQLAAMMGTTQSRISQIEDPNYARLTLATIVRLAACLDCELTVTLKERK